jgi:hypothetical protein
MDAVSRRSFKMSELKDPTTQLKNPEDSTSLG